MASPTSPSNARFSTYSGAPSIQPSLAASYSTSDNGSARRNSQNSNALLSPNHTSTEKTKRASTMYKSSKPAATASSSTIGSSDPKAADIRSWSGALERMNDERLEKQRFVMNENKSDEVSKLALGAKVERALARRMVGQDAIFRVKKGIDSEKRGMEVEAR